MRLVILLGLLMISGVAVADCEEKINKMTDGVSVKDAMRCLSELQRNLAEKAEKAEKALTQQTEFFMSKAVVAFNSDVCPSGWRPLTNGEGRVIVGSGRGNGLSARVLRDLGGSETHTLTVPEMPSHHHPHTDDGVYHNPPNKYDGLATEFRGDSSVGLTHGTRTTSPEGGGQPHNIMQPFVVLKLCEKQ